MQRTRCVSGTSPVPTSRDRSGCTSSLPATRQGGHVGHAVCGHRYHPPTVSLETQGEVHVAVPAVSTLQLVRQQETEEWVKVTEKKPSMIAYLTGKRDIARQGFFDNSRGSGLLAEARSTWRATYSILEGSLYVDGLQTQCIICQCSRGDD
ncbi:hypothetical protein MRX96_043361 [Rhipicephalus microplus]